MDVSVIEGEQNVKDMYSFLHGSKVKDHFSIIV